MPETIKNLFGITNILFTLSFLFKLQDGIRQAVESGESIFSKVLKLMPIIADAEKFGKGLKATYEELQDLTDDERNEVIAYFAKEFDISNDESEAKLEAAFKWGLHTFDFLEDVGAIK